MRHHLLVRSAAARADADEQRALEPAAELVGAFEIHLRGPVEPIGLGQHGKMRRAGLEPHVEDVVLLLQLRGAARAVRSGRQQLLRRVRVPRVRAFALEKRQHVAQRGRVRQIVALAAPLAAKNDERHAPESLPRNATSPAGRRSCRACGRVPTRAAISLSRFPQAPSRAAAALRRGNRLRSRIHLNEPLLGGAEDHGIVAAPAVRIAVREFLLARAACRCASADR